MKVENLKIYKIGYKICYETYKITKLYPKDELYGLVSQIRRAAVSIPSNIAEGYHRNSKNEFKQFLYIALGSASELKTQMTLSKDLKYIQNDISDKIINKLYELEKMIYGFIKSLDKKIK